MAAHRTGVVTLKRPAEIASMRAAGRILADILDVLEAELRPGVTTGDLDEIAARMNMSLRMVEKHIARAITVIWIERNKE